MDKQDIKALLKQGKDCAKKKDYNGALNAGRTVLRYEPDNYTALVLVGFGLMEKDPVQSLESYKKGAKLKPNELACWQGIATNYERKGDKKHQDLLDAYGQISRLHREDKNMEKYAETSMKLAGVLQSQGDFSGCVKALQNCIKTCGHSDKMDQMVVQAIGQMKPPLSKPNEEVFISCLLALHESGAATDGNYKSLFPVLYQTKQFEKLQEVCLALRPKFNVFYTPIEYLCRLYIENHFTANPTDMHEIAEKLLKLYPSSTFGYFALGKVAHERNRHSEAIAWLKEGIESKIHDCALHILIKSLLQVWNFVTSEEYCLLAKKKSKMPAQYDEYHCLALAGQEKWSDVKTLVKKLKNEELANRLKASVALSEENWEEFDVAVNQLASTSQSWEVEYFRGFKSSAKLSQLCEKNPDNLECLLKCGIQLMKMEDFESAILPFNQCLKISPGHPIALFHIGQMHKLDDNVDAAKKFLARAYEALPIPEIGSYLSDLYSELEDNESNKKLLLSASKSSKKSRSKWAWLRLGVLHLHLGEANEAVVALQSAVRTDIQDCHIWEALADAYYARGSYEAALKAYNQCIKLGADPVYPRLRIGVINGHLGHEDMAVEALTALGDYVPALVELSKTWLQIACTRVQEGLDEAAVKAVFEGLVAATRALRLDRKEQILPLILISHLALSATRLNSEHTFEVPAYLLNPVEAVNHTVIQRVNMSTLLLIGVNVLIAALSKPLSKTRQCSMHSDLAKLYYYLATKCGATCIDKAMYHGKKAVSLSQNDFAAWNTLGVIAFAGRDIELAQHCIVKSLELNNSGNPTAWCNVGLLYIANGDSMTGHKCLKEAQNSEPGYGRTWIGMGLVAEGYAAYKGEAMDLFRHAFTIPDTHEFAAFAYAEFLCNALQEEFQHQEAEHKSKHFEAVCQIPECIARYNNRSPTARSLNVQGYIQVHAWQLKSAVESFREAGARTKDTSELEVIQQNLIVALLEAGQYAEVLEFAQKEKEHTFVSLSAAAFASYRLGSFDNAFALYDQARDMCSNSHHVEVSDSNVGQALTAYKLGNLDLAKTLLFKGCQTKQPNFEGYAALCSLGLVTGDIQLATSALAEMTNKCQNERNISDITQLQAYCLVAQEPEPTPLRCILSKIHNYPCNGKLRRLLALHLINLHGDGVGARRHLLTARLYEEREKGSTSLPAVALTYLIDGDYDNALKYGKASLWANVGDPASYAVLVATLTARGNHTSNEADLQLAARLKNMVLASGRLVIGSRLHEWFQSIN